MAFTYDPAQLSTSLLFQVRLMIGDTAEFSPVVLQDEEINYFLEQSVNHVIQAAVDSVNSQISRASVLVDSETGQLSESRSQIITNLQKLRDDLMGSIARNVPTMAGFGGIDLDDMESIDKDDSIYQDGVKLKDKGVNALLFADDTSFSNSHILP